MPMLHAILLRALLQCLRLSAARMPVRLWITRWTCLKARLSRVANAGCTTPWCPSASGFLDKVGRSPGQRGTPHGVEVRLSGAWIGETGLVGSLTSLTHSEAGVSFECEGICASMIWWSSRRVASSTVMDTSRRLCGPCNAILSETFAWSVRLGTLALDVARRDFLERSVASDFCSMIVVNGVACGLLTNRTAIPGGSLSSFSTGRIRTSSTCGSNVLGVPERGRCSSAQLLDCDLLLPLALFRAGWPPWSNPRLAFLASQIELFSLGVSSDESRCGNKCLLEGVTAAESAGARGADASRALLRSDNGCTSTTEENAAMMMVGVKLIQACKEAEKETSKFLNEVSGVASCLVKRACPPTGCCADAWRLP
ncbi:hypothetical protein BKA80DRAFT_250610 [Phyllosticta citrichinensis]